MAVTFTQPNIVACTLRGDPSEIHSASQTGSSARFGAASIASSDAGCGARHTRNLPQGARLSATCSKRMSRKNALANPRAQPELPTADHAMLDGPITIRKEQNPTFQSGIENPAKHAQQGKMLEALFV
ncbi:MAG: hypothetical protein OXB95_13610 [Rhodobacteraceae bacterium]|nr:hypothetical protein [Paracoccaceae bacterium]